MPATAIDYSVLLALLAGGLACATLVLLYRPATAIPRQVAWWLGTAALLLAIAAAGPAMPGPAVDAGEVIVMVDVSPSTRTATYRDETVIRRRVAELLDGRPARVQRFGDDAATTGRTTFTPPPASAILLFSDGQFEPPATAPPVFSVIDPELDSTRDAAITSLDVRPASAGATRRSPFPAVTAPGDTRVAAMDVAVGVRNDGEARKLTLTGSPPAPAERGRYVVVRPAQGGGEIQAQLSPGDAWPENDRLTTVAPPPQGLERWWVTASGAVPPGWQRLAPAELPTNATSYLGAAVVVLENVPAGAIAPPARDALAAAVRELGSGLVILGGDRGFAAGAYEGTDLEAVSPLSSSPPEPAVRWVFLVDASGSMDAGPPGRTRFDAAVAAVTRALPGVPHGDRVSVGGFAADVTWWLPDAASSDAVNVPLPPPGAAPRGATNLASALRAATAPGADGLRRELVVLTDGGADPPPVANELADALRRADARLHVLALGDGPAMPALREAVGATGGRTVDEGDTARWAAGVTQLLRAAKPDHLVRTPTRVAFDGLADPVTASPWNRTWPKRDAAVIARAAGGTPMA
ncbi:MAG TPA: vWA domain-containing protein, partial [Tepidisphaeraceae bacterium]|nr:vWA domain-containing protein [Tepidisphaeraceae bacterium]